MALGRKALTCGVIKGLTVLFYLGLCLCFTVSTLLCMAMFCTAMQSNVSELT
ncbi:unnamed protein product, partial [Staurois parvus]